MDVLRRSLSNLPTERILRVAVWTTFLVLISFTSADPDLWGHVRFGTDILRDGNIHQIDTYSFDSDRPWVNHEWAAEVVSAWAFTTAGNAGLVFLKLLIIGSMLWLLNAALRQEGVRSGFARDVTAGITVVITLSQAHHIRPQLYSLLAFSALMWCLLAVRRGARGWLLVLPPLFALWANFHGGWIVGGGVMVLWTAALLISGEPRQALALGATGGASLAATLANPYGFGLWRFLGETVGFSRPEIVEWQPIYSVAHLIMALWDASLSIATLGVILGGREKLRIERLVVGLALAIASLKVSRLQAFFALTSVFLFAPLICQAYERRRMAREFAWSPALRFAFASVACALGLLAINVISDNFRQVRVDSAWMPEPEAVAVLNRQTAGKRVLVWFNWGEYAIWHLSPRMLVSMDGRRETVYSDGLQKSHWDFYFDHPGGATLPTELRADYIWLPRVLPVVPRLRNDSTWTILFEGKGSVIFERVGLPREPESGSKIATAATPLRVFPGP